MLTKAILLIQTINQHSDVVFDYPLERKLRNLNPKLLSTCDSLSDHVTLHYLKSMLEEEQEVTLVFDCRQTADIGVGRTLLNACVRKEGINLVAIGKADQLNPFIKLMKGKVVASEEQILDHLNSN